MRQNQKRNGENIRTVCTQNDATEEHSMGVHYSNIDNVPSVLPKDFQSLVTVAEPVSAKGNNSTNKNMREREENSVCQQSKEKEQTDLEGFTLVNRHKQNGKKNQQTVSSSMQIQLGNRFEGIQEVHEGQ